MRFFLNIFKKKSKSIEEQLQYIKEDITEIEEKRKLNLTNEKHLIGSLLLYSFMVYFTSSAFIFLYVKPSQTNYWPLYFSPVVAFPFLIFYIKKIIHWFYIRRLTYVDKKLLDLKTKFKQLLAEVVEKETYKRANDLLNKFDKDFEFRNEYEGVSHLKLQRVGAEHNSDSELDKKHLSKRPKPITASMKTVSVNDLRPPHNQDRVSGGPLVPKGPTGIHTVPAQHSEIKLIRPLLNQNRSSFDKIIDFIVGDGFDRRYALICKHCFSHNGMALAEEFVFIGFKCAYCSGFNAPRQTKPDPPRIHHSNEVHVPIVKDSLIVLEQTTTSNEGISDKETESRTIRQRTRAIQ